jgi:hypothetical protein
MQVLIIQQLCTVLLLWNAIKTDIRKLNVYRAAKTGKKNNAKPCGIRKTNITCQ